jgi:hypothetical protein
MLLFVGLGICISFVVKIKEGNKILPLLMERDDAGNTKRGSITVLLTSCLIGLESAV